MTTTVHDDPEAFSTDVLERVNARDPELVVALASGGHDSAAMLVRAAELGCVDLVCHCNTGIGIEQSRKYVRETAAAVGAKYIEVLPPEGERFADIVFGDGHPGARWVVHQRVRQRLKGKAKDIVSASFDGEVVFLTGVRRAESDRRWDELPAVGLEVSDRRGYVWANPCSSWLGTDVATKLSECEIPRNPVRDVLGHSGECLCGCFDSFLNLGAIARVDPTIAHGLVWFMTHLAAWYDSQDEPPWPRQYLVWGHGGLQERELRALFDEPLHDPDDFKDGEDTSVDEDQLTLGMCSSCAQPTPYDRKPAITDGGDGADD